MGGNFNLVFPRLSRLDQGAEFVDVRDVLRILRPEQPMYLFDRSRLARLAARFQGAFPGQVAYAVKANSRQRVLGTLIGSGVCHFDVASLAEIRTLHAIEPGVKLHYNNPVKSATSIRKAFVEYGIRSFALDDGEELCKLLDTCGKTKQLLLSVRFNLAGHRAAYDFGSKFGATPVEAVKLLRRIEQSGARAALTFHPGSQCLDPGEYQRYIYAGASIAEHAEVSLHQLNVGGGFPAAYTNASVLPLEHYFTAISNASNNAFRGDIPPLMCEPGRAMVASSISLLCKVIHVRRAKRVVFINDGVYGGLQEQCLADFRLPLRVWRGQSQLLSPCEKYTVFGPTCDPTDRLPRTLALPLDLREGDYLEFGLAGAYGSATATQFNGFDSRYYVNVCRGYR